jgi:hypothetical protein
VTSAHPDRRAIAFDATWWHNAAVFGVGLEMNEFERQEEEHRYTASLAGLAMAILLGGIGLYVAEQLADISKLEDCLLQGRLNCERIQISGG